MLGSMFIILPYLLSTDPECDG